MNVLKENYFFSNMFFSENKIKEEKITCVNGFRFWAGNFRASINQTQQDIYWYLKRTKKGQFSFLIPVDFCSNKKLKNTLFIRLVRGTIQKKASF